MPTSPDSRDRRTFLTQVAGGSVALAASGLLAGGLATHLTAQAAHAEPVTRDADFSEAWLAKLTGKHRQFFDVTSVGSGWGLAFARTFLDSNNATYKLADSNVNAVVGLRHFAIPIALTDEIWARYKLGEALGITDPATKAPSVRNFLYHPHKGDLPLPGMEMETLLTRGVQFTCCNVALTVLSGMTAGNAGVTPEAAYAEWTAKLVPGVVLVPSGVLAVNRAQEKGCTYCIGG